MESNVKIKSSSDNMNHASTNFNENDAEAEELNLSSTQISLEDEIEEGEFCMHEEYIETKMPNDPVPTQMTKLRFSTPTTMILLREYRKRIDKFRNKTIRRNLIWAEIVNEFYKMNYYTTVSQLSEKFRNLKKFFFVVKDNGTITWIYFKIFSQIMKAETDNLPLENFTDEELTTKRSRLPTLKFKRINNKFKKAISLKRKPGRPPKKKRSLIREKDVKNLENYKNNPYPVIVNIPLPNVSDGIPLPDPVQQLILPIDTQNINALETDKDNEICVVPSQVNHEIPTGIPNVSEELSEFQKRVLHIEEQKRDELRNLRLSVEENSKIQKKTTKLLERICERFLKS